MNKTKDCIEFGSFQDDIFTILSNADCKTELQEYNIYQIKVIMWKRLFFLKLRSFIIWEH